MTPDGLGLHRLWRRGIKDAHALTRAFSLDTYQRDQQPDQPPNSNQSNQKEITLAHQITQSTEHEGTTISLNGVHLWAFSNPTQAQVFRGNLHKALSRPVVLCLTCELPYNDSVHKQGSEFYHSFLPKGA